MPVLVAVMLAVPTGAVLAQDGSPAAESPSTAQTGGPVGDVVSIFPTEVDGMPLDVQFIAGQDILAQLDPDSPSYEADRALWDDLATVAGVPIEAVTFANGSYIGVGQGIAIAALQVHGADDAAMQSVLDDWLVPGIQATMSTPIREAGQVGDRDVQVLYDDGREQDTYRIFIAGDTIWFAQGDDDLIDAAFGALP